MWPAVCDASTRVTAWHHRHAAGEEAISVTGDKTTLASKQEIINTTCKMALFLQSAERP